MGNSSSNKADTSAYFSPVTGVALNVGKKKQGKSQNTNRLFTCQTKKENKT